MNSEVIFLSQLFDFRMNELRTEQFIKKQTSDSKII